MTYIGKPIKRVEDERFLKGIGKYTDDIKLPGMTYAYILRSPYAHAKINGIDISAAKAHPGVLGVFVGSDIPEAVAGVPCGWQVNFKNGDSVRPKKGIPYRRFFESFYAILFTILKVIYRPSFNSFGSILLFDRHLHL